MLAFQSILVFIVALTLSFIAIPIVRKVALIYGVLDYPDTRRVNIRPVPRIGGVGIVLSFLITSLLWSFDSELLTIFLGSIVIFIVGLFDDFKSLSPRIKLFIQIACATSVVINTELMLTQFDITSTVSVPLNGFFGTVLPVLIIVGAINAINMIDGLDGLAGGIVLIGISLLSLVYFLKHHDYFLILYFSIPIVGAILGFLRYNTYPASIFMGDGGSNWLGYMAGVLLVIVLGDFVMFNEKSQLLLFRTPHASQSYAPLISVLMCFSIPVMDAAAVILSRLFEGKNPMHADKRHLHHTLLNYGFSHSESVIVVYFLSLAFGVVGIAPIAFPGRSFEWLPWIGFGGLVSFFTLCSFSDGRLLRSLLRNRYITINKKVFGRRVRIFFREWDTVNRYLLYALILFSPVFSGVVARELGYLSGIVAGLLLLSLLFLRSNRDDVAESVLISVATAVLLVANNQNYMMISLEGQSYFIQTWYNAMFIVLFLSNMLYSVFTAKLKLFLITSSDFLLVTLPLLFLVVPEPWQSKYHLSTICLRCWVLFMVLRTMMKRRRLVLRKYKLLAATALTYIFLTNVFGLRILY